MSRGKSEEAFEASRPSFGAHVHQRHAQSGRLLTAKLIYNRFHLLVYDQRSAWPSCTVHDVNSLKMEISVRVLMSRPVWFPAHLLGCIATRTLRNLVLVWFNTNRWMRNSPHPHPSRSDSTLFPLPLAGWAHSLRGIMFCLGEPSPASLRCSRQRKRILPHVKPAPHRFSHSPSLSITGILRDSLMLTPASCRQCNQSCDIEAVGYRNVNAVCHLKWQNKDFIHRWWLQAKTQPACRITQHEITNCHYRLLILLKSDALLTGRTQEVITKASLCLACGQCHEAVFVIVVSSKDGPVRCDVNLCMATSHVYMFCCAQQMQALKYNIGMLLQHPLYKYKRNRVIRTVTILDVQWKKSRSFLARVLKLTAESLFALRPFCYMAFMFCQESKLKEKKRKKGKKYNLRQGISVLWDCRCPL